MISESSKMLIKRKNVTFLEKMEFNNGRLAETHLITIGYFLSKNIDAICLNCEK